MNNVNKKLNKFLDVLADLCEELGVELFEEEEMSETVEENYEEHQSKLVLDATKLSRDDSFIFASGAIGRAFFEFCSVLDSIGFVKSTEKQKDECIAAMNDVLENILVQNKIPYKVRITKE